jgi:carboxylate-amine ligase
LEAVLGWLPAVLALSCNSPFLDGVETGMLSNRAGVLAELPRGGAPPAFESYAAWEAWVERLVSLGVMADYTRLWWDVRPHPRFGTLEIRIADQPTSLARTELLVRLIRDLVADAPSRVTPRGDYLQNRWAAARHGIDARLIHPDGTRLVGVGELLGFEPPAPEATLLRSAPQLVDETLRF